MINTAANNDPWVLRQFEGFGGASSPNYVLGDGGYSPFDATQQALTGPSNADPTAPVLMNVNPLGSGFAVFVGKSGDGNGAYMETPLIVNGGNGGSAQGTEIGPSHLPQLAYSDPLPSMTTAQMPTMVGTALVMTPSQSQPAAMTPEYLNQRLPTIVDATPAVVGEACGGGVDGWVGQHPVMAFGLLVGLACVLWGKE